MNLVKMILRRVGFIKKKSEYLEINGEIGIIQPTKIALENNTIDKFNKIIIIRAGVQVRGNEIRWGRILRTMPYSEERIKAIKQVNEIPIVERKFDGEIDFFQEPGFGTVENVI